jgi:putative ABC transport system permease protein
MKTPLAWLNLLHDKMRTGVAIAGVAFALILILMQLGFYSAVLLTATRVYDELNFDLLLTSTDYLYMARAGYFPRTRLAQVGSLPEVADVSPLYLGVNVWLNKDHDNKAYGLRRGVLMMGVDPRDDVFRLDEIKSQRGKLQLLNDALMDNRSRPEFGKHPPGWETEVGDKTVRVIGNFTLGTGFSADGALLVSDLTFVNLLPVRTLDDVSLGLITLKPGADQAKVAARLREMMRDNVQVFTRDDVARIDRRYWVASTSVGIIFGLGVVVAIVVGIGIVYQVLSSDIEKRLPEYATLKAMGYTPNFLSWVVLQQALMLAVGAFIPALIVSEILYYLTEAGAHIPMQLSPIIALLVLTMSVVMCVVSGLLSFRKVKVADAADLFV